MFPAFSRLSSVEPIMFLSQHCYYLRGVLILLFAKTNRLSQLSLNVSVGFFNVFVDPSNECVYADFLKVSFSHLVLGLQFLWNLWRHIFTTVSVTPCMVRDSTCAASVRLSNKVSRASNSWILSCLYATLTLPSPPSANPPLTCWRVA